MGRRRRGRGGGGGTGTPRLSLPALSVGLPSPPPFFFFLFFLPSKRPGLACRYRCRRRCGAGAPQAPGRAAGGTPSPPCFRRGVRVPAGRARERRRQRGRPRLRVWEYNVLLGNAAGKSEPPSEVGGIKSMWGPPAVRLLYGVNCAWWCTARRLKGPKPVNKTHLQDKTSPCQRIICGFWRHVSSLPPAPRYVAIPTPARGSLSLAQQLLCLATSISPLPVAVPVTSAATAVKQTRIQAQKACDLPSILQGSWPAVTGGMQAVHLQHTSSPWQFLLWMLPVCKSHEVGYSDLKMEDGSGNQPVVWWNKSQQYFL